MTEEHVLGTHEHDWPQTGSHFYGPWMPKSRTEQYRMCVHPSCTASETREAPKG